MENKFYIYFHINPLKNEVFYVGKGEGKRIYQKQNRNKYWINTSNKYGYIVDIIESDLTEEQAFEREVFYIKKIGRRDLGLGTLVNMTDGGDGGVGRIQSIEERNKRSSSLKGRISPMKGIKHSDESKLKMSNKRKGMKFSEAHKQKLSDAKKGIPMKQKHKDKISNTKKGKRVSIKSEFKKGMIPWNKIIKI